MSYRQNRNSESKYFCGQGLLKLGPFLIACIAIGGCNAKKQNGVRGVEPQDRKPSSDGFVVEHVKRIDASDFPGKNLFVQKMTFFTDEQILVFGHARSFEFETSGLFVADINNGEFHPIKELDTSFFSQMSFSDDRAFLLLTAMPSILLRVSPNGDFEIVNEFPSHAARFVNSEILSLSNYPIGGQTREVSYVNISNGMKLQEFNSTSEFRDNHVKDGSRYYVIHENNEPVFYDVETNEKRAKTQRKGSGFRNLIASSKYPAVTLRIERKLIGERAVNVCKDAKLRAVPNISDYQSPPVSSVWSEDGTKFAVAFDDGCIGVWSIRMASQTNQ